jgi:hypothetical protein
MSDVRTVYQRARIETAKLLGHGDDLDNLSPEAATRLDIACALRIALDDSAAKLLRGESTDVAKLLSASEALAKLLPATVLASPPPANASDPRAAMWETYLGMRKRGELFDGCSTYEGMKAEVERLRGEIAALKAGVPAPGEPGASTGGQIPPVGGSNVVPLSRPPSPPAVDTVVDLRASRANGAGGSAGFRVGPGDEPWRGY